MTQMLRRKIPPWPCIDALELVVNCGTDQDRPKKSKKKNLRTEKTHIYPFALRKKLEKAALFKFFEVYKGV